MERNFEDWMKRVDDIIERRTGFSSADLADVCYRDMFEDDATPTMAARYAIRNAQE